MIHDPAQVNSLIDYVKENSYQQLPYDTLLENWLTATAASVQDADTVDYYLSLLPMIERSMDHEV